MVLITFATLYFLLYIYFRTGLSHNKVRCLKCWEVVGFLSWDGHAGLGWWWLYLGWNGKKVNSVVGPVYFTYAAILFAYYNYQGNCYYYCVPCGRC